MEGLPGAHPEWEHEHCGFYWLKVLDPNYLGKRSGRFASTRSRLSSRSSRPSPHSSRTPSNAFCHYVHFFPTPESAARWTAEHPGSFAVSVQDANELGATLTHTVFGDVIPARTASK